MIESNGVGKQGRDMNGVVLSSTYNSQVTRGAHASSVQLPGQELSPLVACLLLLLPPPLGVPRSVQRVLASEEHQPM